MARMPTPRWLPRLVVIGATLLAGGSVVADNRTLVSFENVRVGGLPPGFRLLQSADAKPGRWEVERLGGTVVLSQTVAGRPGYQLAVLESPFLEHLRAGVRLRRGTAGDGAAGLAWRVQDAGNYYAARLDFHARQLVLYKFVRGNRISLEQLSDLRLDDTAWHELVIEHLGEEMRVWLNGIPVASERDRSLSTPGMLGPWLPSDSTASFTDLWYEPVVQN